MRFGYPLISTAALATFLFLPVSAIGQTAAYQQTDGNDVPSGLQVDSPPLESEGQIQYSGGPLQSYLNASLSDPARDSHLPFGANFVLPMANDRAELFGGIGGVYAFFQSPYANPNSWLTQTTAGARLAVDPGRHVWLGVSARYLASFTDSINKQRAYGSADLTYRFGH